MELVRSLKTAGSFVVHLLLSTFGVIILSGFLTFASYGMLHTWNPTISAQGASSALTLIPGFPIQATAAIILGAAAGKLCRGTAVFWVWVVPAAALCFAMSFEPRTEGNLFAHYFGTGCNPSNRCFDQLGFTLPTIAAVVYSLSARISREIYKAPRRHSREHSI
jgi:hypothetical protein